MLLLPFSTLTVVGQIQSNVRMVGVVRKRAFHHGAPVRRRVANVHNGPTLEFLAAVPSTLPSDDRELCHVATLCMIHPIHRDLIVIGTNEKYLRNGLCPAGPLGAGP